MIGWLNSNSGAVMAVLTLVYVTATVVLVALSWWNIHALWELDRRRSRPHVVFDLVAKEGVVHAVLRNIGATAATDVRVEVTPALQRDGEVSSLMLQTIAYVAPGREFWDAIDEGPAFFRRYKPARFTGLTSYRDEYGKKHGERFTIDLDFQRDLLVVSKPDIPDEVQRIRKALEQRTG